MPEAEPLTLEELPAFRNGLAATFPLPRTLCVAPTIAWCKAVWAARAAPLAVPLTFPATAVASLVPIAWALTLRLALADPFADPEPASRADCPSPLRLVAESTAPLIVPARPTSPL